MPQKLPPNIFKDDVECCSYPIQKQVIVLKAISLIIVQDLIVSAVSFQEFSLSDQWIMLNLHHQKKHLQYNRGICRGL